MLRKNFQKNGFTIIEVVLVLAVAGLIFLMVFLALPALQRSQRDTQRKSDIARLKAAYQHYKANNKGGINLSAGNYVENFNNFMNTYMRANGENFKDPSGADYHFAEGPWGFTGGNAGDGLLSINPINKCGNGTEGRAHHQTGLGDIAVHFKLETGGIYCVDFNE
ncbi:type II secretion system protein [Candidatus Saccharibacteria bacterium]|nr:type II secretion system protein [Candidatus Saccharibacteria bacterium]